MKIFYIITNQTKDPDHTITNQVKQFLIQKGGHIAGHAEQAECILVLGGDGTLLRAATDLVHCNIPFLGINIGGLGFLAEVDKASIAHALDRVISDDFALENRMMLLGTVNDKTFSPSTEHALNDIVIVGTSPLQLIYFNLTVNGLLLNRYVADGMIISTPTGSTGYNLSAGGPIIEPRAEMILLTPLCHHSLRSRSIILSPEDDITITVDTDKYNRTQELVAVFDGNRRINLATGDTIKITKSEKATSIIKLSTTNFFEILQRKMAD